MFRVRRQDKQTSDAGHKVLVLSEKKEQSSEINSKSERVAFQGIHM